MVITAIVVVSVTEWVKDRVEEILPRRPEDKLRSRRLRIWRREKARKQTCQEVDENTAKRNKSLLGNGLRKIIPSSYNRELEEEIFDFSRKEAPLEERELLWIRNSKSEWTTQAAFLTGGEDGVVIISPAAAVSLGFVEEGTESVLPAYRSRSTPFNFGRRAPDNKICEVVLSICGKEMKFSALVKELETSRDDVPEEYVVLPSRCVFCMHREDVHRDVWTKLLRPVVVRNLLLLNYKDTDDDFEVETQILLNMMTA